MLAQRSNDATTHSVDPLWFRVMQWSGRLTCAGLILAIAVMTLGTMRQWRENEPAVSVDRRPREGRVENSLDRFLQGHWEFAGAPWQFALRQVRDRELESALLAPPASSLAPIDVEWSVVELLEQWGVRRSIQGEHDVLLLESRGVRAAAWITPAGAHCQLDALRLALARPEGGWTVTEAVGIPRDAAASRAASPAGSADQTLLPLPATARIFGTRRDSSGMAIAEVGSFDGIPSELIDFWRQHGVHVDPRAAAASAGTQLACRRRGGYYYASLHGRAGTDAGGILLIARLPDG